MSEQYVLETRNLVKEFKGFVAVNDVNLQIRQGDIHALIGPNGAGKTTVFNLLTKFLIPTRGQILYRGEDITPLKSAAIARKGIVRSFQISAVFPHMTALENIRVALQTAEGSSYSFWKSGNSLHKLNERCMELLESVGLAEFAPLNHHVDAVQNVGFAIECVQAGNAQLLVFAVRILAHWAASTFSLAAACDPRRHCP